MKTPGFWQSTLDLRSVALAPLGWLWCFLARRRLEAYRSGKRVATRLPVPVIVMGNVTVGGSGKTPLTQWLARELAVAGWKPAILSRGYGAQIKGEPIRVKPSDSAFEVGDEPLLLKQSLGDIEVIVHPRRALAGWSAIELGADVLLLDDGLQHLQLARDIEIAVVDGARGLGNGRCLPAGPLREPSRRLAEVDAIVIQGKLAHDLGICVPSWNMSLRPDEAVNLLDGSRRPLRDFAGQACDALAGIAHPQRFFDMLRRHGLAIEGHAFADHHAFGASDLAAFGPRPLLMTEKDAVKCRALIQDQGWSHCWHVPVEAELEPGFYEFILSRLETLRDGQTTA